MKGSMDSIVQELEFTKDVLDAVVKLDDLGDSTKNEAKLLQGFAEILKDKLHALKIAVLMFSEKGSLRVAYCEGEFDQIEDDALAAARDMRVVRKDDLLFVPLGLDKAEGIFVLQKDTGFTDRDLRLADSIESQADSILAHSRTFRSLELRAKELEVLYEIDRIRDTIDDFDKMIDAILLEIISAIKAKIGFIVLFNKKGDIADIKLNSKRLAVADLDKYHDIVKKISAQTIDAAQLVQLDGDVKAMSIPLILEKSVIGVFGVIDSENEEGFLSQDERILKAIASQADTAIFEDQKKRRIKDVFKRYVSEKVVEEMLDCEDEDFMSGKRQVMSVLFADIRGFTSFSERTEVHKLVDHINMYLGAMTDVIMEMDGTLDKFVGDEVMALFGAPIWTEDHAVFAVKTAIAMQKRMAKLNEYWANLGDEQLNIGIGINSGMMAVGNIGCEKMADYTVLGDNVNLGARLCNIARPKQIIISSQTHEFVKDLFECKPLEPVMVKGKEKPVQIFEVVY